MSMRSPSGYSLVPAQPTSHMAQTSPAITPRELLQAAIRTGRLPIRSAIRPALRPRGFPIFLVAERRAAEQLARDHHARFMVVEGIPDIEVEACQRAVVPALQQIPPP